MHTSIGRSDAVVAAGTPLSVRGWLREITAMCRMRWSLAIDMATRRRGEPAILYTANGKVRPGSRRDLCVFAHFDRDGIVDDYVVHYIRSLHDLGLEIVFVSTAPGIRETSLDGIRAFCRSVIVKENLGYDFASWKAGLQHVGDLYRYDRLVLANDSVYGPLRDLGPVFRRMVAKRLDFWGVTESWMFSPHLQSYFLVFERPVLQSRAFHDYWCRLPSYAHKNSVILRGELGLSRYLQRHGYRMGALCAQNELCAKYPMPALSGELPRDACRLNPTHWRWKQLIEDHAFPFLKVDLLRDNLPNVSAVGNWEEVVKRNSDYDSSLIRQHLKRVGGPNCPGLGSVAGAETPETPASSSTSLVS